MIILFLTLDQAVLVTMIRQLETNADDWRVLNARF